MEYTIYTDGSAFGMNDGKGATKDTPAGWGFVVVEGPTGQNHDEGTVVAEQSTSITDSSQNMDWRKSGSNNTGELSAIYYALSGLKKTQRRSPFTDGTMHLNMTFGNCET